MAEPRLNTTVVSKRRASVAFKVYGAILTPGQPSSLLPAGPLNLALLDCKKVEAIAQRAGGEAVAPRDALPEPIGRADEHLRDDDDDQRSLTHRSFLAMAAS
jgi:hypothetical protein